MIIARTLSEFMQAKETLGNVSIGLVPTMGALHEGHMAVIQKAKQLVSCCIVTIFVNQLQFDQAEDYNRYPKTEEMDLELLRKNKVSLVWLPRVEDIYPNEFATYINVKGPALNWEGNFRKGHFCGVATIVNRLFSLVKPNIACFGEKDWQQLQVIKRMVEDLNILVTIYGVPIKRESNGLALSSRNRFLTSEEYEKAPLLYKILKKTLKEINKGQKLNDVLAKSIKELEINGFKVDYFAAVNGNTMETVENWEPDSRLITAATLGSVRLIDNI